MSAEMDEIISRADQFSTCYEWIRRRYPWIRPREAAQFVDRLRFYMTSRRPEAPRLMFALVHAFVCRALRSAPEIEPAPELRRSAWTPVLELLTLAALISVLYIGLVLVVAP
jgi:hypothetical protein